MNAWANVWVSKKRRGLRGWVLISLGRGAKNGAELMDEMERMSGGWWRPSPGSIYPLLDELAKEGLLQRKDDGRYELAPKSRGDLGWPFGAWSPRSAEDAVRELLGLASYLEDLGRSGGERLGPLRPQLKELAERLARLSS